VFIIALSDRLFLLSPIRIFLFVAARPFATLAAFALLAFPHLSFFSRCLRQSLSSLSSRI
jgi:hypothetical protein